MRRTYHHRSLDYYRINKAQNGSIKPFTEDGIEALLKSKQMPDPRSMLSSATQVMNDAARSGMSVIDGNIVNSSLDTVVVQSGAAPVTK